MADLETIVKQVFPRKSVVVLGDLVADQFLRGTIARVSREAPVFILRHDETETRAGAAANAAVNIASLGARVSVVGLIGKDANGESLHEAISLSGADCASIVAAEGFRTITKVRVLAGQHYASKQQVIRIDYENTEPLNHGVKVRLVENLRKAGESADAIVISDYNYGVAFPEIVDAACEIAARKKIPLVIDSRFRMTEFMNATAATPNQDEVEQILGKGFTDNDCVELCDRLGYEALVVTRGNEGMLLIQKGQQPLSIDAVGPKTPLDVTGAGDTVIAAFALGLASGLTFLEAATIANHAGGIVVMKKGTASVMADELIASMQTDRADSASGQTG